MSQRMKGWFSMQVRTTGSPPRMFLVALLLIAATIAVVATAATAQSAQGKPAQANAPQLASGGPQDWDAILKKHVQGDFFDYAGLAHDRADLARLDAFLRLQAEADLSKMSRPEQIAFYINAYNSCCVKAILDHYPVHSPHDVDGFFDKPRFKVAGEELTISQIEYDRLIANYKDMRAHFALVCSDRGCLPLRRAAFRGESLDADLDATAKRFVSDERQLKVDREKGEIWISKLFDWYGKKFTADPNRPAERPELYLKHWVADDVRALLESGNYQPRFIDWDWTLNERYGSR